MRIYKLALGLAVSISMAGLWPASSFALNSATHPTGITISPATQNIDIINGQGNEVVNFSITNDEPINQTVTLKATSFNSLNYTGGIFFIGTTPSQSVSQALTNWLVLPSNVIEIPADKTVIVPLLIKNIESLAPGGHYAALLVYINQNQSSKSSAVNVQPVATSLMFITKVNGATYKMSLEKVIAPRSFFNLPSNTTLTFYNSGNTQVTPRGYVAITDSKNHLISKGIINTESLYLLPGNYRNYQVQLNSVMKTKEIGDYKLSVFYTFDGYNGVREYQESLFLGTPALLIELSLILLIIIAVFSFLFWKFYWSKRPAFKETR